MRKVLITNSSGVTRFKFLTKSRRVYLSIVIPAGMLESSHRESVARVLKLGTAQ
ncbi:MAG: hypothetical protein WCK96_14715 [Methylococcales bacterium]